MSITIRPYSPADREAVRRICCDTGFSGDPVDPLFEDREAFADFLTRYYTDWEPESAFVAEADGEPAGYLLGCLRPRLHAFATAAIVARVAPKVLWRLCSGRYNRQSRAFLKWLVFRAGRETPPAPKGAGHFHFNLLPAHRNAGAGLMLFRAFVERARRAGAKRVYGQIQTGGGRRPIKVFERYGFRETGRREVTKFRKFHGRAVYLSTLVLDLDAAE